MSNSLKAVAAVLVTALVVVEHDREKHIPGVTSGPNSETFLVPEHVAESLIKAGAVKRAEVVDTSALLDRVDTANLTEGSSGLVTNFLDPIDVVDSDKLRNQLTEATSQRDSLIEQLADTQSKLEEAQAKLEQAGAAPTDQAATNVTEPLATGTADPAATDTSEQAAASAEPAAKPAAKTASRKAS